MSVEVVLQHPGELVRIDNVGARGHQVTSGQSLIKGGVISPVKLVNDHLPDGVGPGGALASVTVTLVRHPEVESVWPLGHAGQRGGDGGVIGEELVSIISNCVLPPTLRKGALT